MIIQALLVISSLFFLAIGIRDLIWKKIDNVFVYPLLGLGFVLGYLQGNIAGCCIGLLVTGGLYFLGWLARGIGGGDVKLMAAAGCAAGWPGALDVLVYTAILGFLWAVTLWVWGKASKRGPMGRVPFGLPIGVGTAVVLWMKAAIL